MATETDSAEALEAAGQDADSLGTDAPDGVMTCRQLDTDHELEEPPLLEIESEIEPPEGAAATESPEAGPDAGPDTGAGPEAGAASDADAGSDA